jgi:hypothetical protein
MSLREIQLKNMTVTVFVVEETPAKTISKKRDDASSANLAAFLGLSDPGDVNDVNSERAYRVLGFSADSLSCDSTRIIAISPSEVTPVDPQSTNCPTLKGIGIVEIDRDNPLPFVSLDYSDSLLDYLVTEDDEYDILLDKPTLNARIKEMWCDHRRCHVRIRIKGSFKGKHKTATVLFSYDPISNEECVVHGNFKNRYIRIKGLETCWDLDTNVVCVSATVQSRLDPKWRAHVKTCIPVH